MKMRCLCLLFALIMLGSCLNTESNGQLDEKRAVNNATNLYLTAAEFFTMS